MAKTSVTEEFEKPIYPDANVSQVSNATIDFKSLISHFCDVDRSFEYAKFNDEVKFGPLGNALPYLSTFLE